MTADTKHAMVHSYSIFPFIRILFNKYNAHTVRRLHNTLKWFTWLAISDPVCSQVLTLSLSSQEKQPLCSSTIIGFDEDIIHQVYLAVDLDWGSKPMVAGAKVCGVPDGMRSTVIHLPSHLSISHGFGFAKKSRCSPVTIPFRNRFP
ncbi:hypothetical protein YC2023_076326 [Brassica napus]